MATGKSFDLKNQKMTQTLGKTSGLFKDTSFIVIILNREFIFLCQEKIHSLFTRFTLLNKTSPRGSFRSGRRIGEKPQLRARFRSDEKVLRKLFT